MKSKIISSVLVIVAVLTGAVVIYRMTVRSEPGVIMKKILPAIIPEEPSPYSIKWGAEMGWIVDQDGNGVAAATVTFSKYLARDCDGNITEEPPAWQDTTVTTNEKGEFVYPAEIWQDEDGDKKPQPQITIEAEGFLKRSGVSVGVNYANDNGEIDVFRVGRIEGAIIDPNGQPLADVPLYLSTHTQFTNPSEGCGGCYGGSAKTDENGGFVFDKVPPGQHMIKFPSHSRGCGEDQTKKEIPFKEYATFQMINMKDGETKTDIFLDLRESRGMIKGKVVDKYNRPMAGVNAILFRVIKQYFADGNGWSSSTWNLKSALTDENGNYVLSHIPSGDYQLKASYPYEKGKNYKSGDPLTIYLAGKQEVTFNLVLGRQDDSMPRSAHRDKSLFEVPLPDDLGPRDMMIVDPRGNGIAGASVVFKETITVEDKKTHQRTTQEWAGASLVTDERGVCTLPDEIKEVEGKWLQCYLKIAADGFEGRDIGWFRLSHLKKDCRVDILPLSKIQGQIIGANGKPAKALVEHRGRVISFKNPNSQQSGGWHSNQYTDEEGRFYFTNYAEGVHVIHYTVDDSESGKQTGGEIFYPQNGKNINDLIIDLRQGISSVQGCVLDWDGKPVKKALVRLVKTVRWGDDGGYCTISPEFYRSEKTNRKGEYNIENIRPGVYEIEAVLEGDRQRTSEKRTVAVSDGQAIDLDIRLKR